MPCIILLVLIVSCARGNEVELATDLGYIQGEQLDVFYPAEAGSWPAIVLVHGAGVGREDYAGFATLLAESGAVVFNIDWHVLPAETHIALEDIACAVRYARAHAGEFGGSSDRIVLVGHSTGAAYSGEVATNGDSYVGDCSTYGSALPNALVVLSPAQVPGGPPWSRLSLGKNPNIRVLVASGVDDHVVGSHLSTRTASLLMDAGYQVEVESVAGGHYDLVLVDLSGSSSQPSGKDGPARDVADSILRLSLADQ